jgi:hypothetical protein
MHNLKHLKSHSIMIAALFFIIFLYFLVIKLMFFDFDDDLYISSQVFIFILEIFCLIDISYS